MKLWWFALFIGITMFNMFLSYSVFVDNHETRHMADKTVRQLHECDAPGTTIHGKRPVDKEHT